MEEEQVAPGRFALFRQKLIAKFKKLTHAKTLNIVALALLILAIPFTVFVAQQQQNLQQQAAVQNKRDCSGDSPIIVDPIEVDKYEKFTIKKADGSFSQDDFDYRINPGNGKFPDSDPRKCTFSDGVITCTAKGTGGKNKPATSHELQDAGTYVCSYRVKWVEDEKGPPTQPTKPPQATRPPQGLCDAELRGGLGCTFDNKPRLRASWNLRGGPSTRNCQVILEQGNSKWVIGNDCDNKDGFYIEKDVNGRTIDLKPGVGYKLTATDNTNTCNKVSTATTSQCAAVAPTGTTTITAPTDTQSTTQKPEPPKITSIRCNGDDDKPLVLRWEKVAGIDRYEIGIYDFTANSQVKLKINNTQEQNYEYPGAIRGHRYTFAIRSVKNGVSSDDTRGPNTTCEKKGLQEGSDLNAVLGAGKFDPTIKQFEF